jgi:hypothetical protein
MSTNTVTLTLKGTSNMQDISTSLRAIGTEAKTAGGPLNQLTKSMDQTSKSSQTFGQRLKSFGSNFGQLSASVGSLGGSLVGLTRQYQDLGDSQIRVDRVTLKLSKSQEAARAAHAKLNQLQAKGITSGAQYEQALLDVKQAEEQVKIQTQLLTEAQEDHQRAQEDFWIGLVPTITSAAGTIMGVLQNLMGKKGFGGVADAVGNATAAITGGGIGGKGGGKGGGGLMSALGLLGRVGGPIALVGGGLAGAGAIQQTAGPEFQKGAQKMGAFELAQLSKIGVSRDNIMKLRGAIESFNSIFGLTTATVEDVDAALAKLNGTTEKSTTEFDKINQNVVKVKPGLTSFTKFLAENEAAYRNSTKTYKDYLTSVENAANAMGITVEEAMQIGIDGTQELTNTTKTLTDTTKTLGTTVTSSTTPAIQGMAESVKFLDANLQPIGPGVQQLAGVLGQAQTSLDAFTRAHMTQTEIWVADTKAKMDSEQKMQIELFNTAQQMGITTAQEDDSIEVLQLLIQASLAAADGQYDLAAGFTDAANKARGAVQQISGVLKVQQALAQAQGRGGKISYFVGGKQVFGNTGPAAIAKGTKGAGFSQSNLPKNYFANLRKKNPSGQTAAYRAAHHQHGISGLVTTPTWMLAGEAGPEAVDIAPLRGGRRRGPSAGGGGFGGGGGGGPCFNIYIGGKRIVEDIRYSINDNAGVMK